MRTVTGEPASVRATSAAREARHEYERPELRPLVLILRIQVELAPRHGARFRRVHAPPRFGARLLRQGLRSTFARIDLALRQCLVGAVQAQVTIDDRHVPLWGNRRRPPAQE